MREIVSSPGWQNGGGVPRKVHGEHKADREPTACAEALRPGQAGRRPAGSSCSATQESGQSSGSEKPQGTSLYGSPLLLTMTPIQHLKSQLGALPILRVSGPLPDSAPGCSVQNHGRRPGQQPHCAPARVRATQQRGARAALLDLLSWFKSQTFTLLNRTFPVFRAWL